MSKILIFAGTTEGRSLAELLSKTGEKEKRIECVVSVATEYGEMVMPKLSHVTIRKGRMGLSEMREFILKGNFDAVVDATHPFATVVSENIRKSMDGSGVPYLRLKRNTVSGIENSNQNAKREDVCFFQSVTDCVKALEETTGNILLTTGSKELAGFCQNKSIKERLYVRILPGMESFNQCIAQGIYGKHIIAMQGPFNVEMNQALIHQFDIKLLVTKESGMTGGYREKLIAAKREHIGIYIIGNPEKEKSGDSFEEVCRKLSEIIGIAITNEVVLIGMGMGNYKTLTVQAAEWIKQADVVFGSSRLLENLVTNGVKEPYYLANDILPYLERLSGMGKKVAVLFSGDTGFYSGCSKLYEKLKGRSDCHTIIYPGISSVSYMSSLTGIPWQDATIFSVHGHGEEDDWKTKLMDIIRRSCKTYLLMSGVKDVQILGMFMQTEEFQNCKILVGYQLSYSNERLMELMPAECEKLSEEGLYICVILNSIAENCMNMHQKQNNLSNIYPRIKEECFIRDKVPMTKEEIREVSICKLNLHKDSIVYDVGSGTGTVAIEVAKRSSKLKVYAIEKKELALSLIRKNKEKFVVENLTIVDGEAPEVLDILPAPTHAFIGGSDGKLTEIINVLYQKNPNMLIVINAISLETLSEISKLKDDIRIRNIEVIQVQVSRAKLVGDYQLMHAENPVYICSFGFCS